eukprot:798074-Rhodomonas_salina.1
MGDQPCNRPERVSSFIFPSSSCDGRSSTALSHSSAVTLSDAEIQEQAAAQLSPEEVEPLTWKHQHDWGVSQSRNHLLSEDADLEFCSDSHTLVDEQFLATHR